MENEELVILSKKDGECDIVGYEEVETQFQIKLHILPIFLKMASEDEKIWFYRTMNSHCGMFIPTFESLAHYDVIYFPRS
ncbi:hypothetical protein SDJN03_25957, partial [Cucurbita argyrosperma subsp. sororia]